MYLIISVFSGKNGFAFHIDNAGAKAAADRGIETKRLRGEINALSRKYTFIYMTLDLNKF